MKLKRYISLLLLAVYLFATAGTALASLTCKCVSMKARTEHVCCSHCQQHAAEAAADGVMRAPCCGNHHHSTEIDLYLFSHGDNGEKQIRCMVTDLPPALAAECPCPAHVPLLREKTVQRQAPFIADACMLPVGFRAPPALV